MPGGSAGLEDAVGMLERTRLLDDAGRFERAWHALHEHAAETGVPEIYAPGYREVAALGARLAAAEGLDTRTQRTMAEWREVDTAQVALAEEVRALPGRIAAWQAAVLPQEEPGGLDPDHPARCAWREEGVTLEATAKHMLRPEDARAPYLAAVPGGCEAVRQAAEEVADALRHDRYRAFGWLTKEVVRQARETRSEAFHVPRYGELAAQAEALSAQAALPARTQDVVASWLDYHARCEPICRQIREWPARLDALTADCPERPATLDALTGWRQRAEPLLAEARAMLANDAPQARHLAAMPGERKALAEGTNRLDRVLIEVEARETDVLSSVVQQWSEETGRIGFDSRDYAVLMERARPRCQTASAGESAQHGRRPALEGRMLGIQPGSGRGIPRAGCGGRACAASHDAAARHDLVVRGALAGPAGLPAEGAGDSRRSGGAQKAHAETRARRPSGRRRRRAGRGPGEGRGDPEQDRSGTGKAGRTANEPGPGNVDVGVDGRVRARRRRLGLAAGLAAASGTQVQLVT